MVEILLRLLLVFSLIDAVQSYTCSNNYGCSALGYCDNKGYYCKCDKDCKCFDNCSNGATCTGLKSTPACNRCLATPPPCPNANYSCSGYLGGVNCTCKPNFTGYNCEFALNSPCSNYPCINGGSCSETVDANGAPTGYSCACPSGYDGTQCQHVVSDACAGVSCTNGGKCKSVLADTRGVCECPDAWQGSSCEQPVAVRSCGSSCNGNCFEATAVLNSTSFTVVTRDDMTRYVCEQLMRERTTYEFFIVAGRNCYLGANQLLTKPSTDWRCDTRCLSDNNAWCGTYEFARIYYYPYTNDSKQCTASSCGTAAQGYCVEQMNTFACVCAPGRNGDRCQNADNPCSSMGCQNRATCLPTEDRAGARCICARGYSGDKCQNKDECLFMPCKNGGKCTNTNTAPGYSCTCNSAYYGNTCENFSACQGKPCMHGTCTDTGAGTYKCACEVGWTGGDCDQDIDECSDAARAGQTLCDNQGTCVNTPGSYECACVKGTFGFNCSINPDDCDMSYEGPNGRNYTNLCIVEDVNATCVDGFDDYTCKCSPGFTGLQCWDDIDECSLGEVLCEYSGTCINTKGSYYCECRRGTYGFDCSFKPNECTANPVSMDGEVFDNYCVAKDPGGNCTDDFGFYTCQCSERWTGSMCLDDVNECSFNPTPCKHFSTCNNTPGYYECFCIIGTEGHDCEINPDNCANITACNSVDTFANCTDGFAEWWCTCGPDYTGQYCDLEIIIYNILQLLGGGTANEADLIAMMRDLLRNPSKMKDLVPFVIGLQSKANRTAMSWTAEDLFLWVSYEEKKLDLNVDLCMWNDVVLGNCFTFNHFNNTDRQYLMRSAGAQGGLKAAVKLNSNEYLPWTETSAIMAFIHPNTETIFSESPRYNAEPAAETTIQTTESRYVRLGGRYGKCVKSASEGCLRSCYQDAVKAECGCMDSRYPFPDDESVCEIPHRQCVDTIIAKGDVAKWAGCKCPLPCENSQFDASFTKAPFVRSPSRCNAYSRTQRANDSACDDPDLDPDFLFINVQVPRITINIFKETPSWTLNRLIGNIGGLGGVVCGLNLITFFEFGFFFFVQLPMTLCCNRRF